MKTRAFLAVALSASVFLGGVAAAADDTIVVDGDVGDGIQTNVNGKPQDEALAFGSLCPNATYPSGTDSNVNLVLVRGATTDDHYADGSVDFTMQGVTNANAANGVVAASHPADIVLSGWGTKTENQVSSPTTSRVTVQVPSTATQGSFSAKVSFRAVGTKVGGGTLTKNRDLDVSWTVLPATHASCSPADTSAPEIQSFSINDEADWTNSTAVTVDIAATDNVGLAGYSLSNSAFTDADDAPAVTPFDGTDESHALATGDADTKTVYVRVFDAAGNYDDASDTIGLDTIAPTSVVSGFTDGAVLPAPPTASCSATDERSGVATHGSASDSGAAAGLHTVTCNGATDNAGNTQTVASASKTYTLAPIGGFNGNFDGSAVLKVKPNQAIPLKWAFNDGTTNHALLSGATLSSVTSTRCTQVAGEDGTETASEVAAGASGLQLLPDNSYQMNWKAVSTTGCRALTVTMALSSGGTITRTILVNITK